MYHTKQEWKRRDYLTKNLSKPEHTLNIKTGTLWEHGKCTGAFCGRAYRETGGFGLTFNIYSECIILNNVEGFSQEGKILWYKPETLKELSLASYVYSQYIELLEDTPDKHKLLAYLQYYTRTPQPITLQIRANYKLVNVPFEKLATLEGNDKFKTAYSPNDNRIYILDAKTKIESLKIFLQHFEDIAKDVNLCILKYERRITDETPIVYFKPR